MLHLFSQPPKTSTHIKTPHLQAKQPLYKHSFVLKRFVFALVDTRAKWILLLKVLSYSSKQWLRLHILKELACRCFGYSRDQCADYLILKQYAFVDTQGAGVRTLWILKGLACGHTQVILVCICKYSRDWCADASYSRDQCANHSTLICVCKYLLNCCRYSEVVSILCSCCRYSSD